MFQKITPYVLLIILASCFLHFGHANLKHTGETYGQQEFCKAIVKQVGEKESTKLDVGGTETEVGESVKFSAVIKSGNNKNKEIEVKQYFDSALIYSPPIVKIGERIIVTRVNVVDTDEKEWVFVERNRMGMLLGLTLLFLLAILLIGKLKGVTTIVALIYTVLAIFSVYIPGILAGHNIYLLTVIIAIFATLVTIPLVNGFNKKALVGIMGNLGGILLAGILGLIMNAAMHISGFLDPDYGLLAMLDNGVELDLRALVWGGIVIGSLGAIMDIAVSLASALYELAHEMQQPSFKKMMKAGMNIGTDAIGTMTNTLILAYIGSSLAVVLLLTAYNKEALLLFNLEMIVVEILQAVVGSLGILLAVPLTAFFGATVFIPKKKKAKDVDGASNSRDEASNSIA